MTKEQHCLEKQKISEEVINKKMSYDTGKSVLSANNYKKDLIGRFYKDLCKETEHEIFDVILTPNNNQDFNRFIHQSKPSDNTINYDFSKGYFNELITDSKVNWGICCVINGLSDNKKISFESIEYVSYCLRNS